MSAESLILSFIPVLSTIIISGLFIIALINLSTLKKNLKIQSEHQIYTRIFEARLQLEMTETFSNIAKSLCLQNVFLWSVSQRNIIL